MAVGDQVLGSVHDALRLTEYKVADLLVRHGVDALQGGENSRVIDFDELEATGSGVGTHLTSVPCVAARLVRGAAANPDARPSGLRRASSELVPARLFLFGQTWFRYAAGATSGPAQPAEQGSGTCTLLRD